MAGFSKLWQSYPDSQFPCATHGSPNYSNQCAIRMGVCLTTAGVGTAKLGAKTCDFHPRQAGHTLRAREFAAGLSRGVVSGIGKEERYKPGEHWIEKIHGRTGIVYFHHYYNREGNAEGPLNGDHIDLWQRSRITSIWRSVSRIWFGGGAYNKGEVWFWPVT